MCGYYTDFWVNTIQNTCLTNKTTPWTNTNPHLLRLIKFQTGALTAWIWKALYIDNLPIKKKFRWPDDKQVLNISNNSTNSYQGQMYVLWRSICRFQKIEPPNSTLPLPLKFWQRQQGNTNLIFLLGFWFMKLHLVYSLFQGLYQFSWSLWWLSKQRHCWTCPLIPRCKKKEVIEVSLLRLSFGYSHCKSCCRIVWLLQSHTCRTLWYSNVWLSRLNTASE